MSVGKGFHMSDGSTGMLDWNCVTNPEGDKSIIEEVNDVKSDLNNSFDVGFNIFDGNINSDKVWSSSGVLSNKTGYWCTNLIPVSEANGKMIRCNYSAYRFVVFDSSKTVISYTQSGRYGTSITGASFISVSFANTVDPEDLMVAYTPESGGSSFDTWESLFGDLGYVPYTKEPKVFDEWNISKEYELYCDKSALYQGVFSSQGAIESSSKRVRTGYIPLSKLKYVACGICDAKVAYFDSSYGFISLTDTWEKVTVDSLTIPANATYVAFDFALVGGVDSSVRTDITPSDAVAWGVGVYTEHYSSSCYSTEHLFRDCFGLNNATVETDSDGLPMLHFNNTTRKEWFKQYFPCESKKVAVLEFTGKADPITPSDSTGSTFVIEFYDQNKTLIGSKYNSFVLGESRCGYHRYGAVSPHGCKFVSLRFVTRASSQAWLKDINFVVRDFYPIQQGSMVHGHLGMIYSAPKNTLEAFELSKIAGFNTVVTNVNVTEDGVLVALHDNTINATSDGTGNVRDYTYSELLAFDFGSWFSTYYTGTKIPKFEDVIRFFKINGIRPALSLHGNLSNSELDDVCAILKKYGFSKNCLVKSFNTSTMDYMHSILGDGGNLEYLYDGEIATTSRVDEINQYHPYLTGIEWANPPSEIVAYAVSTGLEASMYFGNDLQRVKYLIKDVGIQRFCVDTFSDIVFPID